MKSWRTFIRAFHLVPLESRFVDYPLKIRKMLSYFKIVPWKWKYRTLLGYHQMPFYSWNLVYKDVIKSLKILKNTQLFFIYCNIPEVNSIDRIFIRDGAKSALLINVHSYCGQFTEYDARSAIFCCFIYHQLIRLVKSQSLLHSIEVG